MPESIPSNEVQVEIYLLVHPPVDDQVMPTDLKRDSTCAWVIGVPDRSSRGRTVAEATVAKSKAANANFTAE